jgi:hypothetical protein
MPGGLVPAGRERRASIRYPVELNSQCQSIGGTKGLNWPVKVRDMSVGGVALTVTRRFEPGTVLALDIKFPEDDEPMSLLVRVTNIRPLTDASWVIGCAFARPLGEDVIKNLTR